MITFQCPACRKVLKVAGGSAGKKALCPGCGQKLLVPPLVQDRNKTILGQPVPEQPAHPPLQPSGVSPPAPVVPLGKVAVACPGCSRAIVLPPNELSWTIECCQCGTRFVPDGSPPASPLRDNEQEDGAVPLVQEVLPEVREHEQNAGPGVTREKSAGEKYCVECGSIIRLRASVCPQCGVSQADQEERKSKHCHECGAVIRGKAVVCPECGVDQRSSADSFSDTGGAGSGNRIAAGICGILIGALGVHKFILGLNTPGIIMVLVSLVGGACTFGGSTAVMAIIGLIEGIIYLTKSDAEFYRIYVVGRKEWF